jgi:diguanylate cyclase (GGDEF)-like protein
MAMGHFPIQTPFAAVPHAISSNVARPNRMGEGMRAFLIAGSAIFLSAMLGLASRHAFSVSFWPANAVLVGLMLRDPRLRHAAGWIGAVLGYVAADLLFGRTLWLAGLFAATNLVGTALATCLLIRLDPRDRALRRVYSVLRILACLSPACLVAGLGGAALVRIAYHGSILQTLMTWPASELVNYLITLPAMLTVRHPDRTMRDFAFDRRNLWPAVALFLSCAAAVRFDGPGSIMFPMPALLLCALIYPVAITSVLTMLLGAGCLTAIGLGVVNIGQDMAVPEMVLSIRVAVAFLALVPLTISSAMAVRDDLLDRLRFAADHDGLTGLLNRRAFEDRLRTRLQVAARTGRELMILWLDIDHFKAINDRHGHPAGDAVLRAFAQIARDCCPADALIGRWGGEEFALAVDVTGRADAVMVADRLRAAFEAHSTPWNDVPVRATVSIGACHLRDGPIDIADLVRRLDEALYRAKHAGRNRIMWLTDAAMPASAPDRVRNRAATR